MIYMGSKNRIAKEIKPIILQNSGRFNYYYEPFVGGCNMIDKIPNTINKIGNDINYYLIDMLVALQNSEFVLTEDFELSKEEYIDIRDNKSNYPSYLVGYAGIICSFRGKWFGGYCSTHTVKKTGVVRNYQKEHLRSLLKQLPALKDVRFTSGNYYDIVLPEPSIIYCDPPYKDTTKYKDTEFDHELFYSWCINMKNLGHDIYISEYSMPDEFKCVWQKDMKSQLGSNSGFIVTERLFTL